MTEALQEPLALTLGVWDRTMLAKWFGVKPNSFSKAKEKKLEELRFFADFEIFKGGKINILFVKIPYYISKKERKYELISSHFEKAWNGHINTMRNVADTIYKEGEISKEYKNNTVYNTVRTIKIEYLGRDCEGGTKGWCYKDYFLRDKEKDMWRPMTKEERKIYKTARKLVYGDSDTRAEMLGDMYRSGEYSDKEILAFTAELLNLDKDDKHWELVALLEKNFDTKVKKMTYAEWYEEDQKRLTPEEVRAAVIRRLDGEE